MNYTEDLSGVLGAKGTVIFVVLPVIAFLAWAAPSLVSEPVFGVLLALALGGAVTLDKEMSDDDSVDSVGVSLVLLTVAYTAAVGLGFSLGWLSAIGASLFVLAATAYDYISGGDGFVPEDAQGAAIGDEKVSSHNTDFDVVGLLVAGAFLAYAFLRATGWTGFAHSPVFSVFVLFVGAAFVAVLAGHTVVPREVGTEADRDEELHRLLFAVVNDLGDVPDENLRKDLASKMRLVAGKIGGVKIPTEVEDRHGGVPVVLPDESPDLRLETVTVDEVVDTADDERFTGYVLHGDAVLFFRNGTLFKRYSDGKFSFASDGDELSGDANAEFFALGHMALNDLDDLTPTDEEVVTPEEAMREREAEREEADEDEEGKIQVGGDEIDIDEMFEKADEIIDDFSE